ncbi:MAG: DUF1501 domain-containing protein, partial [Bryobacteraceae bacterium]|nr:DUF1501 domain-containing protein [Bryobacteraceae bacterium]
MNPELLQITRRHFFAQAGFGIGTLALAQTAKAPHHTAKAKNVIFLFMAGGPSQLDMFDHKPKLNEFDGQPCPAELIKGERFAFIKGVPKLLGSPHTFKRYGQSGAELSNLVPHLSGIADDVAIIRSMHTTQFNHAPAQLFMNTGHQVAGRPSMGAWVTYGIGSESKDLPGFVVLLSGKNAPDGGKSCWGSGFLPSAYQGVEFRRSGDPVLFLSNPDGVSRETRRRSLNLLRGMNTAHQNDTGDPEVASRIAAYEMAYQMQMSVPDLADISKEPDEVHQLYGTTPGQNSFANNCLLARRLVERGARFVQLYHRGWDTHGSSNDEDIVNKLTLLCRDTDRAAAALVKDLKRRGLLDSTVVVWGGEFGRTPMNENRSGSQFLGRDHHARAFTMWAAGGGIKPGVT